MEIIEREIKQDFTITSPVIWFMAVIVSGLLLLCVGTAALRIHDWHSVAFCIGTVIFIFVFTRMCLRRDSHGKRKSGKTWKVTNAGLLRAYPPDKTETIRWEQIRHMKWVRWNGLIVRWEESKAEHQQRGGAFKEEFRLDGLYGTFRAKLRVQQDEARELISMAENKTGLSYEKLAA